VTSCGGWPRAKLSDEQARGLVQSLGDIASATAHADPKLKSQIYEKLGIGVTYDHTTRTVTAGAKVCVSEGLFEQSPIGGFVPGVGI
jgi:hypothetical protein